MKKFLILLMLLLCGSSFGLNITMDQVKVQYLNYVDLAGTVLQSNEVVNIIDRPGMLVVGDGVTAGGHVIGGACSGNNIITLTPTTNVIANGTALLDAYKLASTMHPSETNQIVIMLHPGTYSLTNSLTMDTAFIHIKGIVDTKLITMGSQHQISITSADVPNLDVPISRKQICATPTGILPSSIIVAPHGVLVNGVYCSISNVQIDGDLMSLRIGVAFGEAYFYNIWINGNVNDSTSCSAIFNECYISGNVCEYIGHENAPNNQFNGIINKCFIVGNISSGHEYSGDKLIGFSGTITDSRVTNISGKYTNGYGVFYMSGTIENCLCSSIGILTGTINGSSIIENIQLSNGIIEDSYIASANSYSTLPMTGTILNSIIGTIIASYSTNACTAYNTIFLGDLNMMGNFNGNLYNCTLYSNNVPAFRNYAGGSQDLGVSGIFENCRIFGNYAFVRADPVTTRQYTNLTVRNTFIYGQHAFDNTGVTVTYTNCLFEYVTGLNPSMTNTTAKLCYCTDWNTNAMGGVTSISLQNVLNTVNSATNIGMALGSTNTTIAKFYVNGEGGAYTNKPLMQLNRSATGTGPIQVWSVTNGTVSSISSNGILDAPAVNLTGVSNVTAKTMMIYPDFTNNVLRFSIQ